jgi:hypothetical protein
MIIDHDALFAHMLPVDGTPTDLDLESVSPGPGEPLLLFVTVDPGVTGMTGLSLTDSADGTAFTAFWTWTGNLAGGTLEIRIPSDAQRYVRLNLAGTVAGGNWSAGFVLEGNQTAK